MVRYVKELRALHHTLLFYDEHVLILRQGYHVPAVRHRDAFYQKIEDQRAKNMGQF